MFEIKIITLFNRIIIFAILLGFNQFLYAATSANCTYYQLWNSFVDSEVNCVVRSGITNKYRVNGIPSNYYVEAEWYVDGDYKKTQIFNGNAAPEFDFQVTSFHTLEVALRGAEGKLENHTWKLYVIPGDPSGLTASAITKSGSTIAWIKGVSSVNTELQYKKNSGSSWKDLTITSSSNANLSNLANGTYYDVRMRSLSENAIAVGNWVESSKLFKTKEPPPKVTSVSPVDDSGNVSISTNLTWTGVVDKDNDTVEYNVYFGTTASPIWLKSQSSTSYKPILKGNTKYYWRIDSYDTDGITEGNVNSFVTASIPPDKVVNNYPSNNATSTPINMTLKWGNALDDDGDDVSYYVCFGTSPSPTCNNSSQTKNEYTTSELASLTKYYWRIDSWDGSKRTTGDTWSFTTKNVSYNAGISDIFSEYVKFYSENINDLWAYVETINLEDDGIYNIFVEVRKASGGYVHQQQCTNVEILSGDKYLCEVMWKPNEAGEYYVYGEVRSIHGDVMDGNSSYPASKSGESFEFLTRVDLSVSDTSFSNTPLLAGETLTVSYKVWSDSNESFTANSCVYLSSDSIIENADICLKSSSTSFTSAGSKNVTVDVKIPPTTSSGEYFIGVIVDPANEIEESQEDFNSDLGGSINVSQDIGQLKVILLPDDAASNGAQWRIKERSDIGWLNSGITVDNLPADEYTIEFAAPDEYIVPADYEVTINPNSLLVAEFTYFNKKSNNDPIEIYNNGVFFKTNSTPSRVSVNFDNSEEAWSLNDEAFDYTLSRGSISLYEDRKMRRNSWEGSSALYSHYLYAYDGFSILPNQSNSSVSGELFVTRIGQDPDLNGKKPLILIHGWQGSYGSNNYLGMNDFENHPEEYFQEFLAFYNSGKPGYGGNEAAKYLYENYKIYLYHYPTFEHITYNGRLLGEAIRKLPELYDYIQADGKLTIVAHSMGGLVARSFIEEHGVGVAVASSIDDAGDESGYFDQEKTGISVLNKLITLATPHHGSPGAGTSWIDLGFFALKQRSSPGALDLMWDDFDGGISEKLHETASNPNVYTCNSDTEDCLFIFNERNNLKNFDLIHGGWNYEQSKVAGKQYRHPNPWLRKLNQTFNVTETEAVYYLYGGSSPDDEFAEQLQPYLEAMSLLTHANNPYVKLFGFLAETTDELLAIYGEIPVSHMEKLDNGINGEVWGVMFEQSGYFLNDSVVPTRSAFLDITGSNYAGNLSTIFDSLNNYKDFDKISYFADLTPYGRGFNKFRYFHDYDHDKMRGGSGNQAPKDFDYASHYRDSWVDSSHKDLKALIAAVNPPFQWQSALNVDSATSRLMFEPLFLKVTMDLGFTGVKENNAPNLIVQSGSNISITNEQNSYLANGIITDAEGNLDRVESRTNSGEWTTFDYNGDAWELAIENLNVGENLVELRAFDTQGKQSALVSILINRAALTANVKPSIDVALDSNMIEIANDMDIYSINGSAIDSDGEVNAVQYQYNSNYWITVEGTINWAFSAVNLDVGDNVVLVRAVDDDGATSEVKSITITRLPPAGNSQPSLNIIEPYTSSIVANENTSIGFAGNASDQDGNVDSIEYKINSQPWQKAIGTLNWSFSIDALNEQNNIVLIRSKDNVGAYSTELQRELVINKLPVAQNDDLQVSSGGEISAQLTAFDSDSESLSFTIVSQSSFGTVSILDAVDGTFKYVPNEGFVGNDSFIFHVFDGYGYSNEAEISIFVSAVQNTNPNLGWPSYRQNANASLSGGLVTSPQSLDTVALWDSEILSATSYSLVGNVDSNTGLEIVAFSGNNIQIFNTAGSEIVSPITVPQNIYQGLLGDIDGDGIYEIFAGSYQQSSLNIYIYKVDGTLVKTLTTPRSGGSDSYMYPEQLIDANRLLVRYNSGYAKEPRGFAVFDISTGEELWYYDIGPIPLYFSVANIDDDAELEITAAVFTPHNGATGSGIDGQNTSTSDGDLYTIIVDENGKEELTQILGNDTSGGANGSSEAIFSDLDNDGNMELVTTVGHYSSYSGDAQIRVLDKAGNVVRQLSVGTNNQPVLAVADIENDGSNEIIANMRSSGEVVIYNSLLERQVQTLLNIGYIFAVDDINGDGYKDILGRDKDDISILKVISGADGELIATYDFESNVRQAQIVDINGYGYSDIVVNRGNFISLITDDSIHFEYDTDADGVLDDVDNCPLDFNPGQENTDLTDDGGDACDDDDDNDNVPDINDAYPLIALGDLLDTDMDGAPNECDANCVELGMAADEDDDNDGVLDINDAYPLIALGDLLDTDMDGAPNECDVECVELGMAADSDDDNDGIPDAEDVFPLIAIGDLLDSDNDGAPNECDTGCLTLGMTADTDDDNDSLPDTYEQANGLDSLDANDAELDKDGDGLSNIDEFNNNTNPQLADSDGDNINDIDEIRYGLDPTVSNDNVRLESQLIATANNSVAMSQSGKVAVSYNYNVSDGNAELSGLSVTVFFDSSVLSYNHTNLLLSKGFVSSSLVVHDADDIDKDSTTDSYVQYLWLDIGNAWPGALNVPLMAVNFDAVVLLEDDEKTHINVASEEFQKRNVGSDVVIYAVQQQTTTVTAPADFTLDVNGDGAFDGFTDGFILLRYMFGFPEDSIATADEMTDATLSKAQIYAVLRQTDLDINGDGQVDGFTDGFIILRFMFGFPADSIATNDELVGATRTRSDMYQLLSNMQ